MIMTILPKQLFGDNDHIVKVLLRLRSSNEMATNGEIGIDTNEVPAIVGYLRSKLVYPRDSSRLVNLLTKLRPRSFRKIVTTKSLARPIVRFNRKLLDVSRLVTYMLSRATSS